MGFAGGACNGANVRPAGNELDGRTSCARKRWGRMLFLHLTACLCLREFPEGV